MSSLRAGVAFALVAACAVPGCGGASTPAEPFGRGARDLLPDLVTGPIRELYVQEQGRRRLRLRLTHQVSNVGRGPLELRPRRRPCGPNLGDERSYSGEQWIYADRDGDGRFDRSTDTGASRRVVTCLVFHPVHGHWHIDDFVRYEVLDEAGRVLRTSGKVSFCLVDGLRPRPDLPGSPDAPYFQVADELPGDCEEGTRIGLSVGYGDVYEADLADQWVDVTGLRAGTYCVRARTDVRRAVPEVDDGNNDRSVRIRLAGRRVRRISGSCG